MPRVLSVQILGVLLTVAWSSRAQALKPGEVYKKAGPAVVLILGSDGGSAGSAGTGSIITAEGKVITNAHVVINKSGRPFGRLYAFLKPPKMTGDNKRDLVNRYRVKVLAFSPAEKLDLAILQIENPPPNLPTIPFADPDKVQIGDDVVAIGHPEQGGLWTLTTGALSSMIANFGRIQGKDVFQTEASVNRGNSGGPLLDTDGNMIGINTMIARQGAGGVTITDVNFALKSSVAVKWLAGQGMGLAYAQKRKKKEALVLAVPPEPEKPAVAVISVEEQAEAANKAEAEEGIAEAKKYGITEPLPKPRAVEEPPEATIVVVTRTPSKPENVRRDGIELGEKAGKEKVKKGKRLDPKKAKPTYHTQKRPMSLDDIRKQQMQELEDMMKEMRGKTRSRSGGRGLGLW